MGRKSVLLTVVCSFLLAACGDGGPDQTTVDFDTPPSQTQSKADGAGAILDFTAPRLGGGEVNGHELVGKQLAIWFWVVNTVPARCADGCAVSARL